MRRRKPVRPPKLLIAYFAECGPERIPMSLVEGVLEDETERAMALLALIEVSLVKADPFDDGTPAVSVHRLVQAVAQARATANGTEANAAARPNLSPRCDLSARWLHKLDLLARLRTIDPACD
jgi:hypothetical protein